jgi:dimethylaniline monooxygenase (N-oxide forming)
MEFTISLRLQAFGRLLEHISPSTWAGFFNKNLTTLSIDRFGKLPCEWRINQPYKGVLSNPIINDKIVDLLFEKKVSIVQGVRTITPSGDVELSNGDIISDVDTIILCTGYKYDFSVVPESVSPIRHANSQWDTSERTNGRQLHRMYQGFISLDCPDSLAFLGVSGYPSSENPLFDLITMALAQIWKGAVKLPPRAEMEAEVDKRDKFLLSLTQINGPQILPTRMDVGVWMKWLHDVAGTGVNERFTYSWRAWYNWLLHMRYLSNLMSGVNSPHLWRLFDGRRKKWDGAEEAVKKSTEDMQRRKKEALVTKKLKRG